MNEHQRTAFVLKVWAVCILAALIAVLVKQASEIDSLRAMNRALYAEVMRAYGLTKQAEDLADRFAGVATTQQAVIVDLRRQVIESKLTAYIEKRNPKAPAQRIARALIAASDRYGIDVVTLTAWVQQESCFRPHVVGSHGERGLTQIMRSTAKELGLPWSQAFNVEQNIDAGARYLSQHYENTGSMRAALVRYNGAPEYAELVIGRESAIRRGMP